MLPLTVLYLSFSSYKKADVKYAVMLSLAFALKSVNEKH